MTDAILQNSGNNSFLLMSLHQVDFHKKKIITMYLELYSKNYRRWIAELNVSGKKHVQEWDRKGVTTMTKYESLTKRLINCCTLRLITYDH